jgi:hypothetical protein
MTGASNHDRPSLGRRSLLRGTVGLALIAGQTVPAGAAATIPGVPPSGRLDFQVSRNGSQIGTHVLTFHPAGSALTVHIAADFSVGLGPLTFYRYTLRVTEHWQNGQLVAAVSAADNNGTQEGMSAQRQGNALAVKGSKSGHYEAPPGSILATHWNRAELDGPMINPENGELMRFSIAERGTEPVPVGEASIEATHYALTGPATIDLWYSGQSVWSALKAVATDNSMIDYRLG